jgi:hypothetical protein
VKTTNDRPCRRPTSPVAASWGACWAGASEYIGGYRGLLGGYHRLGFWNRANSSSVFEHLSKARARHLSKARARHPSKARARGTSQKRARHLCYETRSRTYEAMWFCKKDPLRCNRLIGRREAKSLEVQEVRLSPTRPLSLAPLGPSNTQLPRRGYRVPQAGGTGFEVPQHPNIAIATTC